MRKKTDFILFLIPVIYIFSCTKDKGLKDISESGYPSDVGKIILSKCATPGCHNNISKSNSGGISLVSWDNLFEGSNNGAVVIPFRPDFSTFCYYINTNVSFGPALLPTMPLNKEPLSAEEYSTIKNWILNGANNNNGNIKFSDNPSRKKIYVINQTCDVVTVFDSETLLPMRYIDVGKKPSQEFPIAIKVSPDGNYWYVVFLTFGGLVQKFDAKTDKLVGEINLGSGIWTTFDISGDSKFGFFADNTSPGKIAYLDLHSLSVLATYTYNNNFIYPTGVSVNSAENKVYVGTQFGNYIYVIDISSPLNPVITEKIIDGSSTILHNQSIDPQFFNKTSDNKFCFIGCQFSNDIRMLDMKTDNVVSTIALPSFPQQIDVYEESNLLFISCPEDQTSFPGNTGSVIVYNYFSKSIIKKINTGFQPYGLGVEKNKKVVAVTNANLNSGGPAPHHSTGCGGRNGYVTFIDLNTLELIPGKKVEVVVFPRQVAIRK